MTYVLQLSDYITLNIPYDLAIQTIVAFQLFYPLHTFYDIFIAMNQTLNPIKI